MIIYKYPLERERNQYGWLSVDMPERARIISVIEQGERLVLYAEVPTDNPGQTVGRKIFIAGTGKEVLDSVNEMFDFIGTVAQGMFVWHIYAEMDATRADL